jgi:hypothetical protein
VLFRSWQQAHHARPRGYRHDQLPPRPSIWLIGPWTTKVIQSATTMNWTYRPVPLGAGQHCRLRRRSRRCRARWPVGGLHQHCAPSDIARRRGSVPPERSFKAGFCLKWRHWTRQSSSVLPSQPPRAVPARTATRLQVCVRCRSTISSIYKACRAKVAPV